MHFRENLQHLNVTLDNRQDVKSNTEAVCKRNRLSFQDDISSAQRESSHLFGPLCIEAGPKKAKVKLKSFCPAPLYLHSHRRKLK